MCSFILVGIIAALVAMLTSGIALMLEATAGFAVGLGLVVFVAVVIFGVVLLYLTPDLMF